MSVDSPKRSTKRTMMILGGLAVLVVVVALVVRAVGQPSGHQAAIRQVFTALADADVHRVDELTSSSVTRLSTNALVRLQEQAPLELVGIEETGAGAGSASSEYRVDYTVGDQERQTTLTVSGSAPVVSEVDSDVSFNLVHDGETIAVEAGSGVSSYAPGVHWAPENGFLHSRVSNEPVEFVVPVAEELSVPVEVAVSPIGQQQAHRAVVYELNDCNGYNPVCLANPEDGERWSNVHLTEWRVSDESPAHYGGRGTFTVLVSSDDAQGDRVQRSAEYPFEAYVDLTGSTVKVVD